MKYELEININKPREEVIRLFDNPDNMSKWQKGLISFEHISGEVGQKGAKSRLLYDMNGRKTEMIETITKRNLPEEFSGTYEAKGVFNIQENYFYVIDDKTTKWKTISEFRFKGLMKIIAFLFGSSFKKTSYKFMVDFKNFAESQ
ncbi:SRPBCC family protein [Hyphobacterium sp. CCMP332]|nr:SRPBCC family protein [Hyphobacterium sp. CCMP332]